MNEAQQVNDLQMEWRQCPGCPQRFKVLTTSTQVWHSDSCRILAGGEVPKPKKKKAWDSLKKDIERNGEGVKHWVNPPKLLQDNRSKIPTVTITPAGGVHVGPPMIDPEPAPIAYDHVSIGPAIPDQKTVISKASKKGPEKDQIIEPIFDASAEAELKWQSYVTRGQDIVSRIAKDRLLLAELAVEACEITHGGGSHWSGFKGVYTLTRFAKEIGINYKTLHNWVRLKQNVYDKLIQGGYEVDVIKDWAAMTRVTEKCDKSMTPEQIHKKFKAWRKAKVFNPERYFLAGVRKIKSLDYYLTTHNPSKDLFEEEDIKQLKAHAKSILKWANE